MDREDLQAFFMGGMTMWDDLVKEISTGYGWPSYTAEGIMENYHHTHKRLVNLEERFKKTPVSTKGGRPLQPATIRQLEREKESLIQSVACYQKFIKVLVKKNMLPTSKLISGEDRKQFVFSLWTMLELPELGKAVYYANRLTGCRHDQRTPATKNGYAQMMTEGYYSRSGEKEQARESMYDALIDSLGEAIERIKKERQRLLSSGEPWKPKNNNSDIAESAITNDPSQHDNEKQINQHDGKFKVHKGGLYKPPEAPTGKADDILSDSFKAWWRKERVKTDHHTNA